MLSKLKTVINDCNQNLKQAIKSSNQDFVHLSPSFIQILTGKREGGNIQHCFTLSLVFSNTERAISKIFFKKKCTLCEQTISAIRMQNQKLSVSRFFLRFMLADSCREVMLVYAGHLKIF